MKKIIITALTLVLILGVCVFPAAAAGSGSLSMTDVEGKQGDTVTVAVTLSSNPGLITMKFAVSYPSDLELLSVSNSGLLGGWTTPAPTISSPYTIRWADSLVTANNTATGKIVTLTFKIKDSATPGNKTVSLTFNESRDANGSKNTFGNASATVKVTCKSHNFGGYVCINDTQHSRTCSACNYVEKTNHGWDSSVTKQPSCKETGVKSYNCRKCRGTKTETIAKSTTHTYTNNSDTTCNVCGEYAYPGGNTLVKENGIWYHVVNRQKVNDTTLVYYGGYWFYIKDGVINYSNTLCKWNSKWYHVKDGKVVFDTTLVNFGGSWFYVKSGVVDFNATTLCYFGSKWYYVKGGQVNYSNTLCSWNGKWYHVKNGTVVFDTTLVNFAGKWYYVKSGVVDFNATTLCYFGSKWYYVKGGQVNYSNTLCSWNGKWYHVKNGTVVYDTTLVYFGSSWYYVKNGVLNYSNTLCNWNGKWWHVKNGTVVKDTTLVYFGSNWYYVRSGVVDFTYSGKVLFSGSYYTVKNGVKV